MLGVAIAPPPQRRHEVVFDPDENMLRRTITAVPVGGWGSVPTRAAPTEIRHQGVSATWAFPGMKPARGHNLSTPPAIPAINGQAPPQEDDGDQSQQRANAQKRPTLRSHSKSSNPGPFWLSGRARRRTTTNSWGSASAELAKSCRLLNTPPGRWCRICTSRDETGRRRQSSCTPDNTSDKRACAATTRRRQPAPVRPQRPETPKLVPSSQTLHPRAVPAQRPSASADNHEFLAFPRSDQQG
jgi:hypothetical protein